MLPSPRPIVRFVSLCRRPRVAHHRPTRSYLGTHLAYYAHVSDTPDKPVIIGKNGKILKRAARGGWACSKLDRMQQKAFFKQLNTAEEKWRSIVESKVRVLSPEEIEEYAAERGLATITALGATPLHIPTGADVEEL